MSIIELAQQATRDAGTGPKCKLVVLTAEENAALREARARGVTWKQLAAIVNSDTARGELATASVSAVSNHVRGECSCEKGDA